MPTSSTPPHILLIDDHAMFRAGLNMVIGSAMPRVKISEAATIDEALSLPVKAVDLVLLDIKLQGVSGIEGITLLKQSWPMTPILMLSSLDEPQTERLAIALEEPVEQRPTAGISQRPEHLVVHAAHYM